MAGSHPRAPPRMRLWLVASALSLVLPIDAAHAQPCARTPLRVGVDIGHSRAVPGAISATGKAEYAFNARFVDELLERSRAWPALDLFVLNPAGGLINLASRPAEAADRNADAFLSIHHDHVNRKYIRYWQHNGKTYQHSDAFEGYSLFVAEGGPNAKDSFAIAKLIGKNLKAAGLVPTLHHAEPISGGEPAAARPGARHLCRPLRGSKARPFTGHLV